MPIRQRSDKANISHCYSLGYIGTACLTFSVIRHSGSVKKAKEGPEKKMSKKQKSIIAGAALKTLKKAK